MVSSTNQAECGKRSPPAERDGILLLSKKSHIARPKMLCNIPPICVLAWLTVGVVQETQLLKCRFSADLTPEMLWSGELHSDFI